MGYPDEFLKLGPLKLIAGWMHSTIMGEKRFPRPSSPWIYRGIVCSRGGPPSFMGCPLSTFKYRSQNFFNSPFHEDTSVTLHPQAANGYGAPLSTSPMSLEESPDSAPTVCEAWVFSVSLESQRCEFEGARWYQPCEWGNEGCGRHSSANGQQKQSCWANPIVLRIRVRDGR